MDRCSELCTKEQTGTCALCEALEERDRFIWLCMGGFLLALWARLSDKNRVPLLWWWPLEHSQTFVSKDEWKRQHDETSTHIHRLMLILITFSFFCLLSLGAPDSHLLSYKAVIQLPFVNTNISFRAFLFIGPLVLITVNTYLHVFVDYHRSLGVFKDGHALPFIFNMQNHFARGITGIIFYCFSPLILLTFGYKASPRPEGRLVIILAAAYAAIQTSLLKSDG